MNYRNCEIPMSLGVLCFIWWLGHLCPWSWGGSDWGQFMLVDDKTLLLSWVWGLRKRRIRVSWFSSSRVEGALHWDGDGGSGLVCVWWGHVLFKGIANRKWRHRSLILSELNVIVICSPSVLISSSIFSSLSPSISIQRIAWRAQATF